MDQRENLCSAYVQLETRVGQALHTQVGNGDRLAEVQGEVLS
jgi:hypothetical protein